MTIFENIDKENNKRIGEITVKISKAESEISKLKENLNIDTELEDYSNIYLKIQSYEDFIKKSKSQITLIRTNPYKKEDLLKERDNIQKEYNPKLKKVYNEVISQFNKLDDIFNKYQEVTEEFMARRNDLNSRSSEIGETCSVYDGNGIKNDFCDKYSQVILKLKEIVRDNKLE